MTEKKSSTNIDPDIIAELKKQIVQELKSEQKLKREEEQQRREQQKKEYEKYIINQKSSPDPWVDVTGWIENEKGVKVELEWNDALISYLKEAGVSGTDDDQVVQKWITLLLRDMTDKLEEQQNSQFQ